MPQHENINARAVDIGSSEDIPLPKYLQSGETGGDIPRYGQSTHTGVSGVYILPESPADSGFEKIVPP